MLDTSVVFKRKLRLNIARARATFEPWDKLGYERREVVRRVLSMLSRAFGWPVDDGSV